MKYFFLAFTMSVALAGHAQNLKFEGELSGLTADTKVILSDMMKKKFHDTATVQSNAFSFDCKLPGAGLYVLRVGLIGKKPENRILYLDAGNVTLKGERGKLKNAALSGDEPYMKDWLKFDDIQRNDPILARQKRENDTVIMLAMKTGSYDGLFSDTAFVKRSGATYPLVSAKKIELAKTWLAENPNSDINAYVIYKFLRMELSDEEMKRAMEKLSPASRNSLIGKKLISGGR
ncbi:protein of unknown function [Pedobacter sp. ok626]|uniref:DUF4369 domain-containing protein n=1 Tax=Pedobacter sp. ok626 TaxID=1761882 RepID=UPI0008887F52|nr:DUF4369 domain-containing protein [Pedobacter sp. ok626]SDK65590.1 protein of unknown function [Pedobacter sp. ok626]